MEERFEKAIRFATEAHKGQKRKMDGAPFILHPFEVASIASGLTADEDILIAALLHDTVEDTPVRAEDITAEFGEKVSALVACETEDKRPGQPKSETWHIRKEESLNDLKKGTRDEKILWLSDKLSNMRSLYRSYLSCGDAAFNVFNQKNKEEHAWYYRTVGDYTAELSDTAAHREYMELIRGIFDKGAER